MPKPLKACALAGVIALSPAAVRCARAEAFFGTSVAAGDGYSGFGFRGGADVDSRADWTVAASYYHAHDAFGTESRSNQLVLGASHVFDGNWGARASLTDWYDSLNSIGYVGPSFGFSYKEADRYKASFDNDLFLYRAGTFSGSRTRTLPNGRTLVISGNQGSIGVTQWHPYLTIEKPFGDRDVVLWASAGHYFYSQDPAVLEARAGQPVFSASAAGLSGIVGGLLRNSGQIGSDFQMPYRLRLSVSLGEAQLAADGSWATTQGLGLARLLEDWGRLSLDWSRLIEGGATQNVFTFGLTGWF